MPPVFWFLLLPVAIVLWWCFIMWTVSHLCGWSALARHYRAEESFRGSRFHFRSGKIGSGNYNACLTVGANSDGLSLAVIFPFRVAHPPLFIPWTDLNPQVKHHWIAGASLVFEVAKTPHVKVRLPLSLGEELAAEANVEWSRSEPPC